MIQDLEGATSEPARRTHVVVLSATATAVSLILLVALLTGAPHVDSGPLAAVPAPSPTAGSLVFSIDSGATRVTLDQVSHLPNSVTSTECAAGIGSSPPVHLVFGPNGRVIAAYTSGRSGRFIPLPPGYDVSVWFSVPCDTPDVFAPRINRVR